jgi:hypothetical protein
VPERLFGISPARKARADAKRKKVYFQLLRRVRRLRKRLLRDLESVRRNLEGRADLLPSRRLVGEEALCLIAEDLAALEQAANLSDHPGAEEAFRAPRDAAGSGLIKTNYSGPRS